MHVGQPAARRKQLAAIRVSALRSVYTDINATTGTVEYEKKGLAVLFV